jgi:ABC-2 type transport system permease protein
VSRVLVIARRELLAAFVSPVMWLTIAVAWLLAALLASFVVIPAPGGGELSTFVYHTASWWLWLQLLIVPIFSMRVLSEEKRTGTIEALMTAPVADHEVVLGKFLAVNVIHAAAALILPLLTVPFIMQGKPPDAGQVVATLITALGSGALLLAVGVFASSLTSAQVLAAFVAILIGSALIFGPTLASPWLSPEGALAQALARADLREQVRAGALGILDLNHFAYQAIVAALFLLFAVRALEVRKWK